MKVYHLSHSDISGGAARATYRIHRALCDAGVDSTMLVDCATSGDWRVHARQGAWSRRSAALRRKAAEFAKSRLHTGNPIIHSPAILPSGWPRRLNGSDADIIHLHWVGAEMLSVADIGSLHKPVVWTLHDMWAFCGAEHYTEDDRWRKGYARGNRPPHESGFDLNRWTWQRKRKHWKRPMTIVAPSHWLADCVRASPLMRDWPVQVIPNPIDTERWRPIDQSLARSLLHLPQDAPLLLFGAIGGSRDPRKGFDLLLAALGHLRGAFNDLHLLVFGETAPRDPPDLGFPITYTGRLTDDLSLRAVYSAADVFVVPSRQDNLPNTAVEAQACGTPVVAFDIGGLPDIVEHMSTGYLASAFDNVDLAEGIRWVMERHRDTGLAENVRKNAEARFSYPRIADNYRRAYAALP
jgi:glycosyltransferase involved in cell wall biosynthesis